MIIKKQLPIGISTFSEIIAYNFLYIDKTELIYQLITTNRRCFLSRPRRFGKSLLISTLKEIFLGNAELFKDLWMGKHAQYNWTARPVVHLDCSKFNNSTAETLQKSLNLALDAIAQQYGIVISEATSPDDKINTLISTLGTTVKVAVLIDEYDTPLLKHIADEDTARQIREVLNSFYATIKGLDEYIHFTFVTGVTKFSKTSLVSGPNNLNDISLEHQFSSLCGYTEQEIVSNFDQYIQDFSIAKNMPYDAIMNEMRTWYNGYQMSDIPAAKIYNPYSVLLYLHKQQCKNYWFATGTPTFLVKLIKENLYDFTNIDHAYTDSSLLENFEVEDIPLVAILHQTGYLTIEKYDEENQLYQLMYPNQEIKQSLNQSLLRSALILKNNSSTLVAMLIRAALKSGDISAFCRSLQQLFAHIPYQLHIEREAFYHALLQMICNILGIEVSSEISVSGGRIDMVLTLASAIYIFEFKLNQPADEALAQIKERRYYEKYQGSKKSIYLVGMAFDYENKHITYASETA